MDSTIPSSYDKFPSVTVPGSPRAWTGSDAWQEAARHGTKPLVVDTYPGVELDELQKFIAEALPGHRVLNVEELAARPVREIDELIAANLTDDRVFGVLSHHALSDFYDAGKLADIAAQITADNVPTVLVGWGAGLVPLPERTLVLADMARWELQQRQRAGAPNWRCSNHDEDNLRKYKRSFFVEWRVADRHKRQLFPAVDYVLDTNRGAGTAKLITGQTFHRGMAAAAAAPFRVVPFFDPGVWGGQWMKKVCGLDSDADNYAWCFDCVPEENSILLDVGGEIVELPSVDVVFTQPAALLGPQTYARFGAEFPIRFDFLDTMGGGNLSLQVHPLTDYIQDRFGMHYTQDESYYILDCADDAVVYLGLKTGTDPAAMLGALKAASDGGTHFPAEDYVNAFPAKKARPFLHSRRHGALLGRELDGAGDLRHAVHLHLQDVGLGPRWPGRPAPPHPCGPRQPQHPVGTEHRVGQGAAAGPGGGAGLRPRLDRGAHRAARTRVHRGPAALVHGHRGTQHQRHRQRAEPRGGHGGRGGEP